MRRQGTLSSARMRQVMLAAGVLCFVALALAVSLRWYTTSPLLVSEEEEDHSHFDTVPETTDDGEEGGGGNGDDEFVYEPFDGGMDVHLTPFPYKQDGHPNYADLSLGQVVRTYEEKQELGSILHEFHKPMRLNVLSQFDNSRISLGTKKVPTVSHLTQADHIQWREVMRSTNPVSISMLSSGLSAKQRAILEGNYEVSIKPAVDIRDYINKTSFETIDYYEMEHPYAVRHGRSYAQGVMELAGYYLDRALEMNRKPPMIGRLMSNKQYFKNDTSEEGKENFDRDEFFIPVAMIAWVDGLRTAILRNETGLILTMYKNLPESDAQREHYRQISETILFDFLADDHDRLRLNGNWMYDKDGVLLLWDSGISFDHGPHGKEDDSCSDILCGPKTWKALTAEDEKFVDHSVPETECTRICRFSRRMVDRLRTMGPEAPASEQVQRRFRKMLEYDPLWPVFNYAIYYSTERHHHSIPAVQLFEENFYKGLSEKMEKLMNHIDECINFYGEEEVLF